MNWISDSLAQVLNSTLERQSRVDLFLRDDDVDTAERNLERLLDICLRQQVAITLALIPGSLTDDATAFLRRRLASEPELVELHQHGWKHTNHEPDGRKCEFGENRTLKQQFADIRAGKARMGDAFG